MSQLAGSTKAHVESRLGPLLRGEIRKTREPALAAAVDVGSGFALKKATRTRGAPSSYRYCCAVANMAALLIAAAHSASFSMTCQSRCRRGQQHRRHLGVVTPRAQRTSTHASR
jgi:hypothetical protein